MSYVNSTIVSKINTEFAKGKKLADQARAKQDAAIQMHVDAMRVAMGKTPMATFLKGNAAKNDARREVKELFESLATADHISAASARIYAGSYWVAFEQNVPFQRDLFKGKAKPASDKGDDKKAGEVKSTTREALDKTLSKAIEQARLLGLTEFAAEMLDLCIESLDGFTEAE